MPSTSFWLTTCVCINYPSNPLHSFRNAFFINIVHPLPIWRKIKQNSRRNRPRSGTSKSSKMKNPLTEILWKALAKKPSSLKTWKLNFPGISKFSRNEAFSLVSQKSVYSKRIDDARFGYLGSFRICSMLGTKRNIIP